MNPPTTQQPYAIPQIAPTFATQPALSNKLEKYKISMYKFGITEIVLGGIIFVFDIVLLSLAYDVGQGIWCGSILIACGIVGVVTRSKPSYCMYNANMVLSILSAVFMAMLVILSSLFAVSYYGFATATALQSVIAILGFAALVISIVHAAYSCGGACYPSSTAPVLVPVQISNGQVVIDPSFMNQPAVHCGYNNPNATIPAFSNQQQLPVDAMVPTMQYAGSVPVNESVLADSPPSYSPTM